MRIPKIACLVLVGALLALPACAKQKESVDLVKEVPPVSTSMASVAPTLETMAALPPAERGRYLERAWPHLSADVVYFLRRMGKITPASTVSRVEFRYGSLGNVRAESRDGERFGFFRDQLVALIHLEGTPNPIAVIVECLNGTFALPEELGRLQTVGSHTPVERFRIGHREGLIHHVDFPTAIALAEHFRLPLYKGRKIAEKYQITPAEARLLEPTTSRLQVTVYVVQGDEFDLRHMTFTPSPRRHSKRS